MPFSISKDGYGAGMQGGLGALIGNDFSKYKTTNPFGLENYAPEGFGNVNIDGGTYNVRYDNTTGKFMLSNTADPHQGAYVYGQDGKLENYTPYNKDSTWSDFGMFLASALSMGAAGMAGAAAGTAADTGAVGGAGGFIGEGAMSGIPAWDAAGTALGGTGAMGAGAAAGGIAPSVGLDAASVGAGAGSVVPEAVAGGGGLAGAAAGGGGAAGAGAGGGSSLFGSMGAGDLAGAAVKYGAPLIGGLISSNAAGKAADTQAAATDRANAMLRDQYNTTRGDLAPWRDSGVKANNALVSAMGLGPNDGSAGYGSLTKPFTGADLVNEPGYQFGLTQGQKAIDGKAAAGGSYFSGNALKAAARYGTDYAGTKYGEAFNRDAANKGQQYGFLSGMSTQGQNAANMTGQFGSNATGAIAGNTTALGNAQGASQIAQGNALQNALGSVTNTYNQDNMLQQLLANQQRQQLLTGGNTNGLR